MEHTLRLRAFDRRLFLIAAILFPLIIFVGFSRTYYAKPWFGTPPLPSAVVHVHALAMSLWVLLFVVQVRLIAARRVAIHQRLGWIGAALAAAIIVTGVPTALRAGKYGSATFPPDIPSLAFMIVPFFDLLMFTLFFSAAIYFRRRPVQHKAMMLMTVLNFLPPAIARIPLAPLQGLGPLWFFGLPTALGIAAVIADARQRGHVNRYLLGGLLLLVASYVVRLATMMSDTWLQIATWATSFV